MESAAYKDIVGRIEEIASHVRRQGMEGQRNDTACLLDSREVMRLLCVSRRTLQRLRESKRLGCAMRSASGMSSSGATAATLRKKWNASSGRMRSRLHRRNRRN